MNRVKIPLPKIGQGERQAKRLSFSFPARTGSATAKKP
jgi:hypothetical protein